MAKFEFVTQYISNTPEAPEPAAPPATTNEAELAAQMIYQALVFFANTTKENRFKMRDYIYERYGEASDKYIERVLHDLDDGMEWVIDDQDDD